MLPDLVSYSAMHWSRGIVMPNTKPPVLTHWDAAGYCAKIMEAGTGFQPLMTLYMTDGTTPQIIEDAAESGFIYGVKLYPHGATTNSDEGVTEIENIYPALAVMEEHGLPLLVHGELTHDYMGEVDFFDREERFLHAVMRPILDRYPDLRVVLEHITTRAATSWIRMVQPELPEDVKPGVPQIAATITAHHLLENRNALFREGANTHNFCLPVLKREVDRQALVSAATSREPWFFAGTDSAPHTVYAKHNHGCAGCYTAPHALQLYAEVFDQVGLLERLEDFTSRFGAEYYGLPLNPHSITLKEEPYVVPLHHMIGNKPVVPFWAGRRLAWSVA